MIYIERTGGVTLMVYETVKCPYCGSEDVVLYGKSSTGKQRYMCRNTECTHKIFQMEYEKNAYKPGVREQAVMMVMNGSGTRDTGRVLKISKDTVTALLKKTEKIVKPINEPFLESRDSDRPINVVIRNAFFNPEDGLPVEMDEMWSFYHDKSHQVWLWWAVEHETNTPLAFVFGTREHKYLDELPELLQPFHIGTVYADNNFAYSDKIPESQLVTGKKNTQKIERNHLTLRTRIKRLCRKTICFSKSLSVHKAVIGTFINLFFFGVTPDLSTVL